LAYATYNKLVPGLVPQLTKCIKLEGDYVEK